MPEYLAPGVYVEETSFRAKSIEGVGTSTSAFVGPARRGPIGERSELLTSLADFERVYGSAENLAFADGAGQNPSVNYLAHAVRSYFENGGSRLYAVRCAGGTTTASAVLRDGAGTASEDVRLRARYAGSSGNGRVLFGTAAQPASQRSLDSAPLGSLARLSVAAATAGDPPTVTLFHKTAAGWQDNTAPTPSNLAPGAADLVELLSLALEYVDADGGSQSWEDLGWGPGHPRFVASVLAVKTSSRADELTQQLCCEVGNTVSALELQSAIAALPVQPGDAAGRRVLNMSGGSDGTAPVIGSATTAGSYSHALGQLTGLEDVSIVAAPGSSAYADAQAVQNALITHAESRRAYRIAVLDTPAAQSPDQVRTARSRIDTKYGALYYPWVVAPNPLARPGRPDIPKEIKLPPSGFVAGIYARNDIERGVHKAPANEVVRGALRFEQDINFGQQEMLNPIGVNCLRYLSGRGYRVWGARLASSDPEWKYVSDRRYFNYLESSIDRGTQWAVFEPNGERLWANVRQTISDFLYNEWRNGALLGSTAEQAFFVRCDRSTMTQNDLDNGRLICLIGVAVIKPAEFVIFRIGQKTAEAQS